jgi:ribosomal protein S18 acetylase RimI-like enzyme
VLDVRPFADGDLESVTALWAACGLIVAHNDPATDIAFCRATSDAELFVGLSEVRIVATVMTGHDGHRGRVYFLAVDPEHGGRGCGRRMMRHAEAWLRARGVPKVNLMIRDTNQDVRGFYEAIGYVCEPGLVMARFLGDEE